MAAFTLDDADRLPFQVHSNSSDPTRIAAASAIRSNAHFAPLDSDILSVSIPAFFIGRNKGGFWLARESHGITGGLFLFKRSAVEFAKTASGPSRCALIFPSETFELDIENRGNPLVALVACWADRARHHLARWQDD